MPGQRNLGFISMAEEIPSRWTAGSSPAMKTLHLGARFANIRCNVRRCMLSLRAVSETLRLHIS